jgi:hypothetical protein
MNQATKFMMSLAALIAALSLAVIASTYAFNAWEKYDARHYIRRPTIIQSLR